jgi:hypothetical protein
MNSDTPQQDDLVLLGRYRPHDASRLLERFERAGILFRADPLRAGYGGSNGPTVSIDVRVDARRSVEAADIHRDLFRDALPNYDSSFFREHRNV